MPDAEPFLRRALLQPGFEHLAREADVAADPQARHPIGADGFVDPADAHREQLGGAL
jgi:hypothetical protein